jgi:hypothetical protein
MNVVFLEHCEGQQRGAPTILVITGIPDAKQAVAQRIKDASRGSILRILTMNLIAGFTSLTWWSPWSWLE